MIDYKYILYSTIGIGVILDILKPEDGLMSIGVILGWLIGMMTITQWDIEKKNKLKQKKE